MCFKLIGKIMISGREMENPNNNEIIQVLKGISAQNYRVEQIGNNLKVGAGYNFTDFSDDLTDNDYDANGWFFDITGKY